MRKVLNPLLLAGLRACQQPPPEKSDAIPEQVTMTGTLLQDKINGGWAGQVIGITFGGRPNFASRVP